MKYLILLFSLSSVAHAQSNGSYVVIQRDLPIGGYYMVSGNQGVDAPINQNFIVVNHGEQGPIFQSNLPNNPLYQNVANPVVFGN